MESWRTATGAPTLDTVGSRLMGPPPATVEMFCARAARGAMKANARARSLRKRIMFWVPSLLIEAGKGDLKNVSRQVQRTCQKSSEFVPVWPRPRMHADAVSRRARAWLD